MEIKNKILKSELVNWKELVPLQPDNFKELTGEAYLRLKQSILKNNFVMSFTIWDSGKEKFLIDGVHRFKVLTLLEEEGYSVPDLLPCTFIDCKDKKEAIKLVLIYSSIYAKVQEDGLYELLSLSGINFDDIKMEIDIPDIDLSKYDNLEEIEGIDVPDSFVSVLSENSDKFQMTFVFDKTQKEIFNNYLNTLGKEHLTKEIIKIVTESR